MESTDFVVSPSERKMGRTKVNGAKEMFTARFREGTLARIKGALREGESQAEFIRVVVEEELERRERDK
jgi:hypothetical protein